MRATIPRAAGVCQSMVSGIAKQLACLINEQSSEVGEDCHTSELAKSPFPRASFTSDNYSCGEALQGIDKEDYDRESDKRSIEGGSIGAGLDR